MQILSGINELFRSQADEEITGILVWILQQTEGTAQFLNVLFGSAVTTNFHHFRWVKPP